MILNVILADVLGTKIGLIHLNEHIPIKKRVVQISLTNEQIEAVAPKRLGMLDGKEQHEEIFECFLTNGGE